MSPHTSAPAPDPQSGPTASIDAVADPGGCAPEIDAIRGWAALTVVCFHVF